MKKKEKVNIQKMEKQHRPFKKVNINDFNEYKEYNIFRVSRNATSIRKCKQYMNYTHKRMTIIKLEDIINAMNIHLQSWYY